jgi:hypothetical protein
MFKTLRENIASILKGRGLSIENRQASSGALVGRYDAEVGQRWCSDALRRAILGEGPKRAVPTAENVMQCPMREIGRRPSVSGVESNRQYLQDGALDHGDH